MKDASDSVSEEAEAEGEGGVSHAILGSLGMDASASCEKRRLLSHPGKGPRLWGFGLRVMDDGTSSDAQMKDSMSTVCPKTRV